MKGITSFHDKKKPYELPDGPLETKHIHDKLFDDQPHSHQQILIDQDCIHQCEQQTLHESQHSVPRQCVWASTNMTQSPYSITLHHDAPSSWCTLNFEVFSKLLRLKPISHCEVRGLDAVHQGIGLVSPPMFGRGAVLPVGSRYHRLEVNCMYLNVFITKTSISVHFLASISLDGARFIESR